ncbi:MAG: DUF192 domain-containing protein [Proteobacteria bacterium]|nr:DUF192 domain-containing protein [Pseudomonadota bacterium]
MHTPFARLAAFALFAVTAWAVPPARAALPVVTLDVGGHKVSAEVAATEAARETGLMNRFSIAPDAGMIFVFARPGPQAFWMHNTFVPLSVAFIDRDGRILNIEDMAPQTDTTHWSLGDALYALEMRQGWFLQHGVRVGTVIKGLPKPASE